MKVREEERSPEEIVIDHPLNHVASGRHVPHSNESQIRSLKTCPIQIVNPLPQKFSRVEEVEEEEDIDEEEITQGIFTTVSTKTSCTCFYSDQPPSIPLTTTQMMEDTTGAYSIHTIAAQLCVEYNDEVRNNKFKQNILS